jgi:8-oxo-dGTP pyrophosphatase MutT (NUDIX family)
MLIEGINSPGQWSFPAGSLDPGEEVSVCAARETEEESGVRGVRGCFLGMFQNESKKSKKGGSRSYFFALHTHTVINEGTTRWKDPDSSWESDGWRNRGWFTPTDARPKLKKGQEAVLDALLRCGATLLPALQKSLSSHL